jgi:D-beta-D-heptose 7-phosphate kinase/D-beta-D-heptose 1-phosphate adenosyltransferase
VDAVSIFDDDTPFNIISRVQPDILVKGGDYNKHTIVGRDIVEKRGGRVVVVPLVVGRSTTDLITQIRKMNQGL